jgi:RNA polymerase sigma-70 factor (ECF subfamily)
MPKRRAGETEIGGGGREFLPTAWTQVQKARDAGAAEARVAWDQLIGIYWKPVYFHIRRKGHSVEDAKDLAQQFFASLLEREALSGVDPAKGRFRAFIRACLENFLLNERDRRGAAKRRGDFDVREAETQFSRDRDFDHDWAAAVLGRAFGALRAQAPREARAVETVQSGEKTLAQLAEELGISEANAKVLAHRGRKLLKEMVLRELRATVSKPGDEREELDELFRAFSM